jgi:electron transport complex protein RnfD
MGNISQSYIVHTTKGNEKVVEPAEQYLHISSSPHIRNSLTVPQIMRTVLFSLIPILLASIAHFRINAIIILLISISTSVSTEWLYCKIFRKNTSITDFSAVLTGAFLAFMMPPGVPIWLVAVGAFFSIVFIKMIPGGLGRNFINPALGGFAFLTIFFHYIMQHNWLAPAWGTLSGIDSVTSATPLVFLKTALKDGPIDFEILKEMLFNLFLGNAGGTIGQTSVAAILLGAIWLRFKKVISLRIPFAFIATTFILFLFTNHNYSLLQLDIALVPMIEIMSGGILLGAFYMAIDPVTSPSTSLGKIVFGIGCGILTFTIRKFSFFPDGVCFAIILMNIFVPLIDKYTRPKVYGTMKIDL